MSDLSYRVEWLEAPDVSTPELAATWARYEIRVGQQCVTQVEAGESNFRRSVYGSLHPLAEWITANWWLLTSSSRPSAIPSRYWTWPNARTHEWLRHHNMRAAGNGMAWPNLTLASEGAVTQVQWTRDDVSSLSPVRFMSSGSTFLTSEDVAVGLADLVVLVLDRLAEEGLPKTRLAEDWAALGHLEEEEKAFCVASARLGIDPFSVDDRLAEEIVESASGLPDGVAADFFDNADPTKLTQAARWAHRASLVAAKAATRAQSDLRDLREAALDKNFSTANSERMWEIGYAMARGVRAKLGLRDSSSIDISRWLEIGEVREDSAGLQGLAVVDDNRCGLILGSQIGKPSRVFAQARALGKALAQPARPVFLLSATHGRDERVARAFAAELLAPAAGIREILSSVDDRDDMGIEAAAIRFGVSPMLIKHQYDNQLAHISP